MRKSPREQFSLVIDRCVLSCGPIRIRVLGDDITIQRGLGHTVALNAEQLRVTNLVFEFVPQINGIPPAVKASYVLNGEEFTFKRYVRLQ